MSTSEADLTGPRAAVSPEVVLGLFATAQLMLVLDVTVVNVALPDIGTDLDLERGVVPWVMTIYTLFFGGLMLAGGRIVDRFGPRRVAMVGLFAFVTASALCGLAHGASTLLVGRALQGVSAAILSPAALASALTAFPDERRQRAMAVWATLAGLGSALGVVLGGLLTAEASWRWVFGINVPIGVALIIAIPLVTSPDRTARVTTREPVDIVGAALVTACTASTIYALIKAGSCGWDSTLVWAALGCAAVLGAVFVAVERSSPQPLLDITMFTRRPVVAGAALMLSATGLLVGAFFLGSFSLQHAHHESALRTGLYFLPTAVATVAGAHLAGRALGRVNARVIATVGFGLAALGYTAPAIWHDTATLVAGLSVAAAGLGALFVTAFTASLADTASAEAGLRSAVVNTFHELGGAAGVAVLSTAAGAALVAARPLPGDFSPAFGVGAVVAAVSALVAAVLVPPVLRTTSPERRTH